MTITQEEREPVPSFIKALSFNQGELFDQDDYLLNTNEAF